MQVSAGALRDQRHWSPWAEVIGICQPPSVNSGPWLCSIVQDSAGHALNCRAIPEVILFHPLKKNTTTNMGSRDWTQVARPTQHFTHRAILLAQCQHFSIRYSVALQVTSCSNYPLTSGLLRLVYSAGCRLYPDTCTTSLGAIIVSRRGQQQLYCQPLAKEPSKLPHSVCFSVQSANFGVNSEYGVKKREASALLALSLVFFFFEWQIRSTTMAQQVKVLAIKPTDLSMIPGNHNSIRELQQTALIYTCALWLTQTTCVHKHKIKDNKIKEL